ncbi:zinc-ribbon domain-containing protein [Fructilactobacillus sp. Tb1]|uniref:zinc ribbon domain-containing protein n=1 Tax=Fructilactobacillus sp. Tb1 TaxID=3422304 RepID=UPI003D275297
MKECPNCHYENNDDTNFCVKCGTKLGAPVTRVSKEKDSQNDLEKKIADLESKLKKQKLEKNSVNIFERISFTEDHFRKIVAFSEKSSITILAFFILAVILDPFKWLLLIILMLMLYLYPLLSNETSFPWETKIHDWLNNDDKVTKKHEPLFEEEKVTHSKPASTTTSETAPNKTVEFKNSIKKTGFSFNTELWLGLISLVIGLVLYTMGQSQTQDVSSQVLSVFQNGSLNNGGYLYVIGAALTEFGLLATVGGLVKGFTHNFSGGLGLKVVGVLVLICSAGMAMYVYANPVSSAISAYQSGASIGDMQNLVQVAKLIPWIAGIIYAIGIVLNLVKKDK